MKYPKPGDVGGRLIREVVGSFKRFESAPRLPIDAHILIAVSGGWIRWRSRGCSCDTAGEWGR